MKQIENKEPINANAEYIVFNLNGRKIWVDMYDILDIVRVPQYVNQPLYQVIYKDGTIWNILIDNETFEFYQNFKNNIDKKD